MAIESYFFNAKQSGNTYDRTYDAEDFCSYLELLVGNGVFTNPTTSLQVRQSSGMTVIVGAGQGWINGHKMVNTADMQLTLDQSDVILNRIDSIIFYVDHSTRDMGIKVLKGTGATSPTAPSLTRNSTRYEMCLAQIYVGKQVTSITNANITDTRSNKNLCGFVKGLIEEIDTTNLFQQYDTAFNDWFNEIKDDLVAATLIRKYEKNYVTTTANEKTFNVKNLIPEYAYGLDILEIRINGLALGSDEFTKSGNSVTLNTAIAETGTHIDFVIYKSVDGSDAEKIVDLVYTLQTELEATKITDANGSVKLQLSDSSSDILASFVGLGIGFHTISALAGVQNLPKNAGCYLMGQYVATGYGYLYAMCADGSVYSNIYFNSKWAGWRCLFDVKPGLLWSGALYPNSGVTITPSRKLSECQHGWILTFSQYSNGASEDNLIQTYCIPKIDYTGESWGGIQVIIPLIYSTNNQTGVILQCCKGFMVFDDKLVSTDLNTVSPSNNMVIRSVQEY